MGKLSDDILKWTLDVDGSPARKELTQVSNSTNKLERDNAALGREMAKLEAHGKKGSTEWKKYEAQIKTNSKTITTNKKRMGELRKEVGLNNLSARELRKEMRSLKQTMDGLDPNSDKWKKMNGQYQAMHGRLQKVRGGIGKTNKAFGLLKQALPIVSIGAFISMLSGLGRAMVRVRAEFEKYEAVLTNSLGDKNKALQEMEMLQEFASTTPFALSELTGAFVKLTNYGLKPTLDDLQKMGDLASSVGKGFDQLTEAMADAVTGEFERLKEFGIKARKEGDKITFTFKEQSTEVENTAASIKSYLLTLGEMEGVAGSMEAISKTIGGGISNMGDAWDNMLNKFGECTGGVMRSVVDILTNSIGRVTKQLEILESDSLSFWEKWWGSTVGTNSVFERMKKQEKESITRARERAQIEKEIFELYGHSSPTDVNPKFYQSKKEEETIQQSLIKLKEKELDQARKLPETTEAEIIAKNRKLQVIEKEITRLRELGLLNKKDQAATIAMLGLIEEQKIEVERYFSKAGEGAFEAFITAIEKEQAKKKIDWSLVPEFEEEEEVANPALSYEIQQYQQTLDYKAALLQAQREHGIIGEKEYQDKLAEIEGKKLEDRHNKKMKFASEASMLADLGANLVFSLMDLELEKAGDNEEKKKEIRKKYADIGFATTSANIIANTALAIMKALADLGPIAGAIAAGLMGAAGAVQLGVANAQRKKIKGMKEGGFADKTQSDDEPVGIYHGNEFIGNAPSVRNPTIKRVYDIIDHAQKNGTVATLNLPAILGNGKKTGGYASQPVADDLANPTQPYTNPIDPETAQNLITALNRFADKELILNISLVEQKLRELADIKSKMGM